MDQTFLTIFQIIILILSVVAHEVSHGFAALYYGDRTALNAGRLTMNPIKHIDLVGTIIIPFLLVVLKSPIGFGWAKPVPYNPYNFTDWKWGTRAVAIAGVFTNFMLAVIFGLVLRFFVPIPHEGIATPENLILISIILVNLSLGIFNLLPIPPLDGSKILFSFLPDRFAHYQAVLERNGFFVIFGALIVMQLFNIDPITKIVLFLFNVITGVTLA